MKTRKILAMLLALVMMLSMVACGGQAPVEEDVGHPLQPRAALHPLKPALISKFPSMRSRNQSPSSTGIPAPKVPPSMTTM